MPNVTEHFSTPKPPEYYAAMNGFRGLLAIIVAIYHTIWLSHPQSWRFFENGSVIIDLFFAFSGFLMWRLYSDNLRTSAEAKIFIKRRFARLYPLHIFMLLVFAGFAAVRVLAHKVGFADLSPGEILPFQSGSPENWLSFLQNLTMTNALGLSDGLVFNPPSWTVGAEFWTYVLFAVLMIWFRPKKRLDFFLISGCIGILYLHLFNSKPNMDITYDYGFLRCVAGFYTGVLAAVNFPKIKGIIERLSGLSATLLECWVLFGSVAFVIFTPGTAKFLVAPILFAFVVVFAADKGAISKFMRISIFQYLAKISYSVYLVHVIIAIVFAIFLEQVLGQLPTGFAADIWLIIYLGVVVGVSHVTYHLVEKPGAHFMRNWNRSQKRVAEVAPSV